MNPQKLRIIAETLDNYEDSVEMLSFYKGKSLKLPRTMQRDLRQWADELEEREREGVTG